MGIYEEPIDPNTIIEEESVVSSTIEDVTGEAPSENSENEIDF